MKQKIIALSIAMTLSGSLLVGCQSPQQTVTPVQATATQSALFEQFSTQFIDALWQQYPTWALYSGNHINDGKLVIPNAKNRQQQLQFADSQLALLAQFDQGQLSPSQKIDAKLIENLLTSGKWQIETFKSWQWQPSQYNVASGFAQIINGSYASLEERLTAVLERLTSVAKYYQAARQNIENPTLEHTQLALMQNQGALSVFSDQLISKAQDSNLNDQQKVLFASLVLEARQAVMSHVDWLTKLEAKLTQDGGRSFRIGSELYEQKFTFDIQSDLSAKELYHKALAEKQQVLSEMAKLADTLWPKYFAGQDKPTNQQQLIATVINKLSAKHVKREDFVTHIRAQIPELEAFVNDNKLISLDKDKPLIVRETPKYMQGFAGASISAPGPYDKKANTYYNVTPLDNMSDEQAESYLREYNHWVLQVLNIHEAVPGHYTQLVYSNMAPSLIKSLFGNGAMVEGWAVYSERMMLEEGYGDFEPELWLMYYKWNLRVITNTILDYSIHVNNLSKAQGLSLMMDGAFQQKAEAEGKWRRATLSQVQLTSYYSGFRDIYDFRTEYKATQGDDYSVREFHDKFLSYGSAPVKYIRELMLNK